jgi:RHS repeat-associated protein
MLRQLLAAILSLVLAAPMWASTHYPVGNRTQKVSTLPGYPGGLSNYNANDQLATDAYDAGGNTVGSGTNTGANGYVYDFENHLIKQGGISIVYDGDGNRVSKTVAGVTTLYLVDDQNPTGYAQVVAEEAASTSPLATYSYGLEQISRYRNYRNSGGVLVSETVYYVHDGHGSVRALTDQTGAVTDTYDYDAFGNLIHQTGTTPNSYLFAGEQFDPDLHLYYNRARYLNVSTGRFSTMDTYQGDAESPLSLHKYLYAGSSPVDRVDPSGNFGLEEAMVAVAVSVVLLTMSSCTSPQGTLPVEVRILQNRLENYGVWLDLGARTKSRSPSYPEYNWVQWVTTNAIESPLKKYLKAGVPYRDPARPAGYPPYYYVGKEDRPNFSGYDLGFHDNPHRDPSGFPETGGNIDWNARLLLVGISPAGGTGGCLQ